MDRFKQLYAQRVLSELGVEVLRKASNIAAFSMVGGDVSRNIEGNRDSFIEIDTNITLTNINKSKEVNLNAALDISQSKNIVKTAINGVKGTIKEYIADGDLIINMNVVLGGLSDIYPLDELKALQSILDENKNIIIYSKILNDVFGVTRVVVEGYSFTPTTWSSVQEVKISLLSDMTYKIEEKITK